MAIVDLLGHVVKLAVRRLGPPGAFLAFDPDDKATILVPKLDVPEGTKEGDELEVFIYLDSEDRPIATTAEPKITLGEVAFLKVTDQTEFGSFVDWGLMKELLVPLGEQTRAMELGARYPVGVILDATGRLAGTMRVSEMLKEKVVFTQDEWVVGEAWRKEPEIGLFVIVEQRSVGLVPREEPQSLSIGESARFRVTNVLPDGKIELSLRGAKHEELDNDADKILSVLQKPDAPKVGDHSDPEEIRIVFGLSKKAFKRGVGRLLQRKAATIDENRFVVLASVTSSGSAKEDQRKKTKPA
ncbi:MAG: S1-like domain-containing RNA-binding protein [Polyangiaceae bacterium]